MAIEPTDDLVTMRTYKYADGELVDGEFGWVGDIEYFDDLDDPTDIIEEVWVRQSVRTIRLPKCGACDEPAEFWGLCEKHAREDDPSSFEDHQPMTALEQKVEG